MSFLNEISKTILHESGWFVEREVEPRGWLETVRNAGFPVFESATQIFRQFGGLSIFTKSFQEKPFFIDDNQSAILLNASEPMIEFLPEKSEAIRLNQVLEWRGINYLKVNSLDITPIGTYRFLYPRPFDLFVLSNGQIFGGGRYQPDNRSTERVPGLFYVGDNVEDAVNRIIGRVLAYW